MQTRELPGFDGSEPTGGVRRLPGADLQSSTWTSPTSKSPVLLGSEGLMSEPVGVMRTQLALALRLSSVQECGNEDWAELFRRLCRHKPHRRYLDFTDFAAAVQQESCRHPNTPLGNLSPDVVKALWRSSSSMHHGEARVGLADFIGLLSDFSARHHPATPSVGAPESPNRSQRRKASASRPTQCW